MQIAPYHLWVAPAVLPLDDWLEDYKEDPIIYKEFFNQETGELQLQHRYKYNRLWKDDKIIVPRKRVTEVIAGHHDPIVAGHWGVHRTVSMLRRRFTFPRMRTRVRQHVRTCDTCQHSRADRHLPKGLMEKISLPCQKWQSLAMDWTGGLPRITSKDMCTIKC